MARQEALTTWILQNDVRFDLQVQSLSWIKSIFPKWHDLQVSISVFGERFIGHGSDPESNIALGKAVCEALERATCFSHRISSLGVAGHFDRKAAETNAHLEYIERFCFSQVITEGFSIKPIPGTIPFMEQFGYRGVDLQFYDLPSPTNTSVVLCLATGVRAVPSFGGIVGLGASFDLESAKKKALMECLRSLAFYFQARPQSLSQEEFQGIENPRNQDRQALLRNQDYFRRLMDRLIRPAPSELQIPEGKFEALALDSVFNRCPLAFVRYSTSIPLRQPEFLA